MKNSNPRVHVISRGKKWAVYKMGNNKATAIFEHREQAYFKARQISNQVVVHREDGQVLFQEGFINLIGWKMVSVCLPEIDREIEFYNDEKNEITRTRTYLKNDMIFIDLNNKPSYFVGCALALTPKSYWRYVDDAKPKKN